MVQKVRWWMANALILTSDRVLSGGVFYQLSYPVVYFSFKKLTPFHSIINQFSQGVSRINVNLRKVVSPSVSVNSRNLEATFCFITILNYSFILHLSIFTAEGLGYFVGPEKKRKKGQGNQCQTPGVKF